MFSFVYDKRKQRGYRKKIEKEKDWFLIDFYQYQTDIYNKKVPSQTNLHVDF